MKNFFEKYINTIISAVSLVMTIVFSVWENAITGWFVIGLLVVIIILSLVMALIQRRLIVYPNRAYETMSSNHLMLLSIHKDFRPISGAKKVKYEQRDRIADKMRDLANGLCDIIGEYSNNRVVSSIKVMSNDSTVTDIMDQLIYTVARSQGTPRRRCRLDNTPTTAKENTPYKAIIEDGIDNEFLCSDITKYEVETGIPYRCHNARYKDYYRSLVVLPISKEIAYDTNMLNKHNIIYGFLVVESNTVLSKAEMEIVYQLSLIYAELIKNYIDLYNKTTGGYVYELFN